MSAYAKSNADMLEFLLRKWIRKRHVHNVRLKPDYSHLSVPVGETVIAEVVDRSSQGWFFTESGFTVPSGGFIRYDDIIASQWISLDPSKVNAEGKRENYDHIEFSLRDGSLIALTDVEQAVFPLLRFFDWVLAKKKHAG